MMAKIIPSGPTLNRPFLCLTALFVAAVGSTSLRADSFHDAFGDRFRGGQQPAPTVLHHRYNSDPIRRWNEIAINATGLDHTPVGPNETRIFGEQLGPGRSSRAMAIVHIAMADAVAAGQHCGFESYTGIHAEARRLSLDAAIEQAAHDTLVALYPSQATQMGALLKEDLLRLRCDKLERSNGRKLGRQVAAALLAMRANDGSQKAEPHVGVDYFPSQLAGHWRQDPVSVIPLALGAYWGECTPFVLKSSSQFRTPAPPALNSAEYTKAYHEAKTIGGDGVTTPTARTAEQTLTALYWAYDGTPSLCAPPRLYNQIVVRIADETHLDTIQIALLLALANVAMADTSFSAWESKYHWDFWRPITGIRESDHGTGPTGSGDGNPATVGDPDFRPLGAPASNLMGPNFTPPFPAYPSGHAAFGGALFQVLRRFYHTDRIGFTFVSDEFNGVTKANDGTTRPYLPRSFSSFSQAEEENGQSRIYLGIHWSFDKVEGIAQGRRVADYVFDRVFRPVGLAQPGTAEGGNVLNTQ